MVAPGNCCSSALRMTVSLACAVAANSRVAASARGVNFIRDSKKNIMKTLGHRHANQDRLHRRQVIHDPHPGIAQPAGPRVGKQMMHTMGERLHPPHWFGTLAGIAL